MAEVTDIASLLEYIKYEWARTLLEDILLVSRCISIIQNQMELIIYLIDIYTTTCGYSNHYQVDNEEHR
jgi:hypothetical protein